MAKGNIQKQSNGCALDFEAQLRAATEQAVPAPHSKIAKYKGARPEGLFGFSDPRSEWFNLQRATRLLRSIRQKAFVGELL
ncbi:MAG TPA: hypothetical protein VNN22_20585 [Verrucomicrobiae bacterium]|nr:hypothetical protein [Verrucomicrobiae bacterium]